MPATAPTHTQHPTVDGSCVRDYIHVTDLVGAHALAMEHLANPPSLYNIGRQVNSSCIVQHGRASAYWLQVHDSCEYAQHWQAALAGNCMIAASTLISEQEDLCNQVSC